jgi:hypothetical protein
MIHYHETLKVVQPYKQQIAEKTAQLDKIMKDLEKILEIKDPEVDKNADITQNMNDLKIDASPPLIKGKSHKVETQNPIEQADYEKHLSN